MKRTYADRIGEYYDNIDKVIDWQEELDRRKYDMRRLAMSAGYLNEL